jgi:hypothetical protein
MEREEKSSLARIFEVYNTCQRVLKWKERRNPRIEEGFLSCF